MCGSWCEAIIAIIIIVFSLWQTIYSQWIVVIAAVVLLVHAFMCKKCFSHRRMNDDMTMPSRKKRR